MEDWNGGIVYLLLGIVIILIGSLTGGISITFH